MSRAPTQEPSRRCSRAEYDAAMLNAVADLYHALRKLRPGQSIEIARGRTSARLTCSDERVRDALRTIEEHPEPEEMVFTEPVR